MHTTNDGIHSLFGLIRVSSGPLRWPDNHTTRPIDFALHHDAWANFRVKIATGSGVAPSRHGPSCCCVNSLRRELCLPAAASSAATTGSLPNQRPDCSPAVQPSERPLQLTRHTSPGHVSPWTAHSAIGWSWRWLGRVGLARVLEPEQADVLLRPERPSGRGRGAAK
jgi:hypothetical protein